MKRPSGPTITYPTGSGAFGWVLTDCLGVDPDVNKKISDMCEVSSRQDKVFGDVMDPFQIGPHNHIVSGAFGSPVSKFGVNHPLSTTTTIMHDDNNRNSNGCTRTALTLEPDVVGWVIGKRGAHIKRVKQVTGCYMWLNQSDLKLHIIGNDPVKEAMAVSLVENLVRTAPVRGVQMSEDFMSNFTTKMMDCPAQLVGLLIGRNGTSIKRIKRESMVSIIINQVMGKAIICGSPEGTEKAGRAIKQIFMDNGFIMDEDGLFVPYRTTSSPITARTATTTPKKCHSAMSLLTNFSLNEQSPSLGPQPDLNERVVDKFSLFSDSGNTLFPDLKPDVDSSVQCEAPPSVSFSDHSSLTSVSSHSKEYDRSRVRTPPILYNEHLSRCNSLYTMPTQCNFRTLEELLESINLSHHANIFKANEMDMDALRLSSKEDLKAIGLPVGASIKLFAALNMS